MGRKARIVIPGIPHHITQRGNRKGPVFFTDEHRFEFLEDLGFYSRHYGVDILSYCLMTNHTHNLLVPEDKNSLNQMLKAVHTRHAIRINRYNNWRGHLWQDRFFSAPVDSELIKYVIGYIELNPVRAGIVQAPLDYRWSSMQVRYHNLSGTIVNLDHSSLKDVPRGEDWQNLLQEYHGSSQFHSIRESTSRNHPIGPESFISELEIMTGRNLRRKLPGPKSRT